MCYHPSNDHEKNIQVSIKKNHRAFNEKSLWFFNYSELNKVITIGSMQNEAPNREAIPADPKVHDFAGDNSAQ